MKQLFQNLKSGAAETLEIPTPNVKPGQILIKTHCSLISPGTERMLADFGRAGWISKARQQPEKVKQVLQKMRTDGVEATVKAVFTKLDQPVPVGYSNVGTVKKVGAGVKNFRVGDRVVSNGYHAELVTVPENLCAKIPDGVSDEAAAFTVLGAIALQGVRLALPSLGETFCVYGLGLIGILTCQILKANGCRVIGIDLDQARVDEAEKLGVTGIVLQAGEDPTAKVIQANEGREVDGVLITANTSANGPIEASPRMTRQRGRIVLVGVIGLHLDRTEFFLKEITFQVSCSYGPGRYDEGYEQDGLDYPIGYVRWTEQRNFSAVLDLLRSEALQTAPFVSERVPFESAASAYDRILRDASGLGFLFVYEQVSSLDQKRINLTTTRTIKTDVKPSIGVIGAGNYARGMLLPAFQAAKANFSGIASQSGMSSADLARKFGCRYHTSDAAEILNDPNTTAVIVATRHDSHAELVIQALRAGKHVFVEKPLAMNRDELQRVRFAYEQSLEQVLMVGFNRRFSLLSGELAQLISHRNAPLSFRIAVNAGAIPASHWTNSDLEGGGRIVGEVCHFIDYAHFLTGAQVSRVSAQSLGSRIAGGAPSDTVTIGLEFEDGSIGSIDYFANGHKDLPKERIEVFHEGRVLELNNFRSLRGYGVQGFSRKKLWKQDKGQQHQATFFLGLISGSEKSSSVAQAESSFQSMETTFRVVEALKAQKS